MLLSLRCSPRIEQRTILSLSQRQFVGQTLITRRFDLIGAVHGVQYKPTAKCPKCGRSLTPLEIVQGFRNDPRDYTTACSACHTRFEPKLAWQSNYASAEIPFYCAMQVLAQLDGFETKSPDEIMTGYPGVYHSVRVHHGNLRQAFEKIGVQYPFENITDWKTKVGEFLGKLPDTVVAEVVDMPVRAIRKLRKSLNLKPFSRRELAGEEA